MLEAVHANPGELRIVSDSKYVLDCFGQGWREQWERKGWKTSAGKPVANQDLWQAQRGRRCSAMPTFTQAYGA